MSKLACTQTYCIKLYLLLLLLLLLMLLLVLLLLLLMMLMMMQLLLLFWSSEIRKFVHPQRGEFMRAQPLSCAFPTQGKTSV